jgi:redox-sensing transcriptional repressor
MPGLPPRGASDGPQRSADGPQRSAPEGPPAPTAPIRLLPEATVKRLPVYLRALAEAREEQCLTISSEELAVRVGANAAQVRKDLSRLGSYGTRGIGYDTELLSQQINRQLGLTREYNVALMGAGNLGHALANYRGFAERGFHIVAAFDSDPAKVGKRVAATPVYSLSELSRVVEEQKITMALIATPAAAAQETADRLIEAGVTSLLNFAPALLSVPAHVYVRKVDLAVELQILSYYQHSRQHQTTLARAGADGGAPAPTSTTTRAQHPARPVAHPQGRARAVARAHHPARPAAQATEDNGI